MILEKSALPDVLILTLRRAEHGDEDRDLMDLVSLGIDKLHRLTGIVGFHNCPRLVAMAKGHMGPRFEGTIGLIEPRIALAVRKRRAIFSLGKIAW